MAPMAGASAVALAAAVANAGGIRGSLDEIDGIAI